MGLMQLSKTTWSVAFLLWIPLWLLFAFTRSEPGRAFRRGQWCQVATILTLGLYFLNAGYLFDGTGTQLGDFDFVSQTLAGETLMSSGNRFEGHVLGRIPVPFPKDYVIGLDLQKADFEIGARSFLAGEWKHGGWWFYYIVASLVKVPVGTIALLLLAIASRVAVLFCGKEKLERSRIANEVVLLIPPLSVFVLVSSQTGFNHHFRYVLPCFPFVFVWIAYTVGPLFSHRSRMIKVAVLGCICLSAIEGLAAHPHSLSHFNFVSGGSRNGHKWLMHSSIDWGQDLLNLRRWIESHPEATDLKVAYHGFVDPSVAGIHNTRPGSQPEPGWYAVSVMEYCDPTSELAYFSDFTPVDYVGYSIHVFKLD